MATYNPKNVDFGGKSGIMKAESASARFVNSSDKLYKNAKNIQPIEGYEDIVIHGDKTGFSFKDGNGTEYHYTVREFADILKESNVYHGGNIRLISCETGAEDALTAQMLADQLNVTILAPTDIVWVFPNGEIIIGPSEFENTGKWVEFRPKRR